MKTKTDKRTIETFNPSSYQLSQLSGFNEPSCYNGDVRFKRYKITVEPIEEPVEVYQERLQKLWDDSDNYHHSNPLQNAAKSIGYVLIGERGKNKKRINPL